MTNKPQDTSVPVTSQIQETPLETRPNHAWQTSIYRQLEDMVGIPGQCATRRHITSLPQVTGRITSLTNMSGRRHLRAILKPPCNWDCYNSIFNSFFASLVNVPASETVCCICSLQCSYSCFPGRVWYRTRQYSLMWLFASYGLSSLVPSSVTVSYIVPYVVWFCIVSISILKQMISYHNMHKTKL